MSSPETLRKSPETRQLAIAAARYLAMGLAQKEIADKLGHKTPYINKLLAAAVAWEYLSRVPTVLRHAISDEDWDAAQQRYFQDWAITPALQQLVPQQNHFFEAYQIPGDYDAFLRGAADQIGHLLRYSCLVGLHWGRTVFMLVKHLQVLSDSLDRDRLRQIECIPLCGDPTFLMNQRRLEYSASWLASTLEQALTRRTRRPFPWLVGVRAYVNRVMRVASVEGKPVWRQSIDELPGYDTIFGNRSRLINRVDTIITGAGIVVPGSETLEHSTGDLIEERLQQEKDLTKVKLDQIILGDIGGWLIEKPGLKPADKKLVEDLNCGWTGATLDHLKWVAAAAEPGKRVGNVLVAWGPAKAALIIEAVKRGLVNTLLIDSSLGERVKLMLQKSGRRSQKSSR